MKDLETKGYFINEDGTKSTDMVSDAKKKFAKDVVKPKRPLSAYLFYSTENVNKIKEKEKVTHLQAMAKVGEAWNKMNEKQKKKYNDLHLKDVARFDS